MTLQNRAWWVKVMKVPLRCPLVSLYSLTAKNNLRDTSDGQTIPNLRLNNILHLEMYRIFDREIDKVQPDLAAETPVA
jgi:hypothetical protein